jgi:hypothetical protein
MADNGTKTAASRYAQLLTTRDAYTRRAEKQATDHHPLPVHRGGLHRIHGTLHTRTSQWELEGVNNMASKLLLALFPPNSPVSSSFEIDEQTLEGDHSEARACKAARWTSRSPSYEKKIRHPHGGVSSPHQHLRGSQAGSSSPATSASAYPTPRTSESTSLRQYVVKRSPEGMVLEGVIQEEIAGECSPASKLRTPSSEGNGNYQETKLPSDAPEDGATRR